MKAPSIFRNYISFVGALIVAASLVSIILLFLIELTRAADNPYLGIVTYVILPGFLFLGILIIVAGMLWERRRRRRAPKSQIAAYGQKGAAIKSVIGETQRIYKTYFFPEMKTNWETHPNNIGHLYSSGCFRCHDGEHVSNSGKIISNDCNICHTVLSDSARPASAMNTGPVQHPVDLGGLADRKCETCHKANEPFRHPLNLGDISMFQCIECHPRTN